MMPLCSTLYKLGALRCSESCWSLRKGLLQRVLTSRMRSVYRHITWLLTTRRLVALAEVRNHLSRFLHDVFNNGLAELYTSRCTSWSTCSAMHTKLFHFSVTRCTHHIGGVVSYTHMDIFCIFLHFSSSAWPRSAWKPETRRYGFSASTVAANVTFIRGAVKLNTELDFDELLVMYVLEYWPA